MADTPVYNIALAQLAEYADCSLIVRSAQAQALVERLSPAILDNLAYIQLCSLPGDSSVLIHWAEGLAMEIVLDEPAEQFAQLYRYAKLLDNHPVRVRIPVVAGFEKAVKLALSLQFSVKLDIGQPDKELIDHLARLLDAYLHQPAVSQPIELFHHLLLSFCHREPLNLWAVQEEDPALVRYIDDSGAARLPGSPATAGTGGDSAAGIDPVNFVRYWSQMLVDEQAECAGCAFFDRCRGYFKWPDRAYDCAGIKTLLNTLQQAAAELSADLAAAPPAEVDTIR